MCYAHCSQLIAQRFHLYLMSKSMYLTLTLKVIRVNHLEWLILLHEIVHIIDDFINNRLINDLFTAGGRVHSAHCTVHIAYKNSRFTNVYWTKINKIFINSMESQLISLHLLFNMIGNNSWNWIQIAISKNRI